MLGSLYSKAQRSLTETKERVSNESYNQLTYNAPKLSEYEAYRYKPVSYTHLDVYKRQI